MKSILKTKSMYQEMFGEVPPVIGFLGVDTNLLEYQTIAENYPETSFDVDEQVALPIKAADELYQYNKEEYPWMSKQNTSVLQFLRNEGAGQLRSSGRFIFEYNYDKIKTAIANKINAITSANVPASSENWVLDNSTTNVQIYVVFSMSGGTGCGTFLNFGYLLREMYGTNHDIYAYAVLPGPFVGCGEYVGANAYGAALDIDYIQSNVSPDNPYIMTAFGRTKNFTTQPYDLFYLVDNVNQHGTRYNSQDQIHTMLGLAFLSISGLLSSQIAAKHSNYKVDISSGVYDHKDKKGWVMGHGLCEIKIDTKRLKESFCLKAALDLVSSILGGDITAVSEEAMSWINSNNLCEHKADQLLNTLYDFSQLPQSVIVANKSADAKLESESWILVGETSAQKKINEVYTAKETEIKVALKDKLNDVIARYGLNGAETFITVLDTAFTQYESEMKDELLKLADQQTPLKADVSAIIEEWKSTIFGAAGKFRQPLQDAQFNLLRNSIDTIRHNMAQMFYVNMRVYLANLKQNVTAAITKFTSVSATLTKQATEFSVKKNINPFVIDLSPEIPVSNKHVDNTVSRLLNVCPEGILGLASLTEVEVIKKLESFTSSLNGAGFEDVSIEDYILKLSKDDQQELFSAAMKRAAVLLDVQGHGIKIKGDTDAYISIPSGANSALTKLPEMTQTIQAFTNSQSQPIYVASPSNTSILIYLISGGYPIFQIESLVKQRDSYDEQLVNKSFSFDTMLEQRIKDEHFGFMPNVRRNDDLLELWVKGFIFDLIKKDGNGYVVKSPQLATSLTGLYSLKFPSGGIGTERRAYAFEDFQDHKITFQGKGEIKNMIHELEMSLGKNELTKKYEEYAKMANDAPEEYLKKFAGVSLATVDNNNPNYEKTRTLLSDELNYCKTQLLKSIDSIF